jgi:hypothetical protein
MKPTSPTSLRNLADLARAGFEIARQPLTKVDFEVHHTVSRLGYLRDLVSDGVLPSERVDDALWETPAEPDAVFLETLCSAANGGGMVIGTRTRNRADGGPDTEQRDDRADVVVPQRAAGGWVFHRTGWPNPTFIYESARTFSGLISIDPDVKELTHRHGRAVRDLVEEISEAATTLAGAPLLTLQCPAQLPPIVKTRNHDLRTRREMPSLCSAFAIRFSIALHDASAERQFLLSNRLRELCEERNFGFWIADTRPGHRPGNWFEVVRAAEEPDGDEAESVVTTCLPVTFAGPARVGSTHAIVSLLRRYPRVGVVSCSGTTLSDLAFEHLQLAVEGVPSVRLNKILEKLIAEQTTPPRPRELLRNLFNRLGLRAEEADRSGPQTNPASDYQVFVGPAFDYRPSVTRDALAIWVSWRIARKEDGLAAPLECLYRAMRQVLPEFRGPDGPVPLSDVASVEYLICRATEQSVVRGKGKLAVPNEVLEHFRGARLEEPASKLCWQLDEAWKAQVDLAGVQGVSELTVAWREAWLGHWTYT